MFGIRTRTMMAALVASLTSPVALMAQWGSDCSCYTPQQYVTAPAPVVTSACQCLQPVTQMVQKEVEVVKYRTVQKQERRPIKRVEWVDQKATAYRQVMETKIVEVPTVQYQTVTEYQTRVVPKTQWRTVVQAVPKMAPCQYDSRPGFIGSMNRMGYQMRSAFQPNTVTHRQQVSQVCTCKVPVQRQVAVQSTRKVAYQEARTEPYEITQKVAKYVDDYETVTVAMLEPYKEKQTVSVAEVRMAYVDPYGLPIAPTTSSRSATAEREPTPTQAAESNERSNGPMPKGISYPKPAERQQSGDHRLLQKSPAAESQKVVKVTRRSEPVAQESDGWTSHSPAPSELPIVKTAKSKASVASTQP
jgi:hypothetical protein